MSHLPGPFGPVLGTATIKSSAEDFRVRERLGFAPAGQGEHLLLRVEKTAMTTPELIDALAGHLGIDSRHIGHAGLKDRQAITEQWLSLQLPGVRSIPEFPDDGPWRVLEAHWHDRKLRVGAHRGNAFEVVLREVNADPAALLERIERIRQEGFANYFGEQRFGAGGDNVAQALRALNAPRRRKRLSRQRRGLYLSALRSELFNRVLARRVELDAWHCPLSGDVWMLDGSGSWFVEPLDETLAERHRQGDIHSGLRLHGLGEPPMRDAALALEQSVLGEHRELAETLERQQLKLSLRPHRALARDLNAEWEPQARTLRLSVTLGKGSYLTALLAQLVDSV